MPVTSDREKTPQSTNKYKKILLGKTHFSYFKHTTHSRNFSQSATNGYLEDQIALDNSGRFIDAFVSVIDLKKIGFTPRVLKIQDRPS